SVFTTNVDSFKTSSSSINPAGKNLLFPAFGSPRVEPELRAGHIGDTSPAKEAQRVGVTLAGGGQGSKVLWRKISIPWLKLGHP
ncbi:hypothetical protein FRC01_011308, partial [Tulasnella sp. 417]